jgi:hypothetical protein
MRCEQTHLQLSLLSFEQMENQCKFLDANPIWVAPSATIQAGLRLYHGTFYQSAYSQKR